MTDSRGRVTGDAPAVGIGKQLQRSGNPLAWLVGTVLTVGGGLYASKKLKDKREAK